MQIDFNIENQRLNKLKESFIVENSQNYLECSFIFSDDWQSFKKLAYFQSTLDSVPKIVEIVDDKCIVPHESIKAPFLKVWVIGYKDEVKITTNFETLSIIRSGVDVGDETIEKPSKELWETLFNDFEFTYDKKEGNLKIAMIDVTGTRKEKNVIIFSDTDKYIVSVVYEETNKQFKFTFNDGDFITCPFKVDLGNYYTKTETNTLLGNYYTKTETDLKFLSKEEAQNTYATISSVDELSNIINSNRGIIDSIQSEINVMQESLVNVKSSAEEAKNKAQEAYNLALEIDGSPKGVYASLSALQTAFPSGASGVYLTSDNGHWHYWNGSAWTDGGVYQSSEDVKQIKEDLDYFGMLEGDYIEQGLEYVNDKYLYINGQVNSSTDRKYAMVKVPKSRKIKFSSFNQDTAYAIMYYNSSIPSVSSYVGTYEKLSGNKMYQDEEVTIPEGVEYIGFNVCLYSSVNTYSFYSFEPTKSVDNLKDANFASKNDLVTNTTIVSSADLKSSLNYAIGYRATKDFKLVSFKALSIDSSETIKFYIHRKQEDGTYYYAYPIRDIIVGNKYEIGFDVKKGDYLALWCYTSSPSSVCYCEDKGNAIFDYFDSSYGWNSNIGEWVNQNFNRSVACEIDISENKFEVINTKIDELIPSSNIFDYKGNEISVFTKILCIGDSLTAGGMNNPDVTPNDEYQKRTVGSEYSYPTQLKKQYGVDCTNWGRSGETSVQWYNAKKDEDWSGHDACIIYLGNNDWRIDESSVETSVATNYEYLNKIIDKARADNHGIRIFLCTFLPGWGQQCYGGIINNVKQIVNENADCWLIDLNAYSKCQPNTAYWYTHLTALGYQQMAKEIGSAISYHINHDSDSFKWVRFIGTKYSTVFDN